MEKIINLKDKIKKERPEEKQRLEEDKEEEKPREPVIKPLIEWSASEYEYFPKSADWYWAVAIITLALIFTTVYFFKNIILGVLFFLIGFIVSLYGAKKPRTVNFALTHQGLVVGEKLYPYEHLKSFWLDYNPPERKELIIISKKLFMPKIIISLTDVDPNPIREFLIKILKEEYQEPSLTEAIAKYFRF